MDNIKVNLKIALLGRVLLSEQECSKQVKEFIYTSTGKIKKNKNGKPIYNIVYKPDTSKCDYNEVKYLDRKTNKRNTLSYYTRKCKPAYQSINISSIAYQYFISDNVPEGFSIQEYNKENRTLQQSWNKLTSKEKLEWHLHEICKNIGGVLEDYKIFDD